MYNDKVPLPPPRTLAESETGELQPDSFIRRYLGVSCILETKDAAYLAQPRPLLAVYLIVFSGPYERSVKGGKY